MDCFKANVVTYQEEKTLKITKGQAFNKAKGKYLVVKSKHFVAFYQEIDKYLKKEINI